MSTQFPEEISSIGCGFCYVPLEFDFSFAFQPIIDLNAKEIFGYEALVRGPKGESAYSVLEKVNDENRYAFDQACRVKAIRLATRLKLDKVLSINFLPNAVYEPAHCIRSTLAAAKETGFPIENLMFEIVESEQVYNRQHLTNIFKSYEKQGFITAIDDFGAGHAGLNLLADFLPSVLKIDMDLIRDIDKNPTKQIIVRHLVAMCKELSVRVLAEGLETIEEVEFFRLLGVSLMQGYYFAKPGFEELPEVDFSIH